MMRFAGSLVTMTCVTAGAMACATPAAGQALRSEGAGYEVTVLVDGVPAPTFFHAGETYVLGQLGERYVLRVANHTGRRIEAVVAVDGRDVIDGRTGDFRRKRGYLVPAWGSVDIDGWRLSNRQAAAFRFSSVADSYAARTGSARDVGVIGVAVFPERVYSPPPPPYRPYYPYDEAAPYGGDYDMKRKGEAAAEPSGRGNVAPRASAGAPAPASPMADATEAAPSRMAPPSRRPGLGTEFGEAVSSHVREVEFVRANASRPSVLLGMRYNDRPGLVAMGIDVDNVWSPDDTRLRQTAHPFPVSQRGFAAPPPGWRREW
jgi:hypothetical protein